MLLLVFIIIILLGNIAKYVEGKIYSALGLRT